MIIEAEENKEQRTDDWKRARMGRFSCSGLHRLMADEKRPMTEDELAKREKGSRVTTIIDSSILSTGALTYIEECLSEKLTGMPAKDEVKTAAMQWGIDNEPIAKKIYEAVFECKVIDSKYIPCGENFGGSPDGLIDDEKGFIEIKCPTRPVHLKYKTKVKTMLDLLQIAPEYFWQIVGYFIVTGREYCDFVSYQPQYPGKHQLHRVRILYHDAVNYITKAKFKIDLATKELNRQLLEL